MAVSFFVSALLARILLDLAHIMPNFFNKVLKIFRSFADIHYIGKQRSTMKKLKTQDRDQALRDAKTVSERQALSLFLIQMDDGEEKAYFLTQDETFIDSEEFQAFEGKVLAELYDGVEA